MSNTLKSTRFGLPYNKKPESFTFTYKYTPGETLYKHKLGENNAGIAEVVEGTDECSIAAYLYEVSNYNETLDGTNINTSDKVVLRAMLTDGTAKSDYKEVTLKFESWWKVELMMLPRNINWLLFVLRVNGEMNLREEN